MSSGFLPITLPNAISRALINGTNHQQCMNLKLDFARLLIHIKTVYTNYKSSVK